MSADGISARIELAKLVAENAHLKAMADSLDQPERASAASAVSGLVIETTSRTPSLLVSTLSLRLKRMRYNCIAAANWHQTARRGGFRVRPVMVTLTYRPGADPLPRDLSDYIMLCRKWFARRSEAFCYVWVAELQERGALHYHVVIWMPHGYRLPKPDKQGWWKHGRSRIEFARNAPGYVVKYASKLKTKGDLQGQTIPKGFRMFGVGGLDQEDTAKRRWANLPGFMRDRVTPHEPVVRVKGGFVERITHAFWPSPLKLGRVVKVGGHSFVSFIPALPEGLELCTPW